MRDCKSPWQGTSPECYVCVFAGVWGRFTETGCAFCISIWYTWKDSHWKIHIGLSDMWTYFSPPITAANLRLSTHNHWLTWVSLSYVNQMEKSTEMGGAAVRVMPARGPEWGPSLLSQGNGGCTREQSAPNQQGCNLLSTIAPIK